MATTYGVYSNLFGGDTEIATESIPDGLRVDELSARLAALLVRTMVNEPPAGSTLVVQAAALQRT